jgi:hypothetical protein
MTDLSALAAWNNLGVKLQNDGNFEGAIEAFGSALQIDPANAAVMNNMGFALLEQGEFLRAEEWLRRGIACAPDVADLHNNLGNALRDRGMFAEATDAYRHAIMLQPAFAQAHWNLAQVLLQLGEYEEGWVEYEWRWQRADFTSPNRDFGRPVWNGEDISGKTILVHAEQGFGDALQFVRYVPLMRRLGADVLLECQAGLTRLFSSIPGVVGLCVHGTPLPPFDVHIPMMSLARVYNTSVSTVPSAVPYLFPGMNDEQAWRTRLQVRSSGYRVGFAWSGTRHLRSLQNRACSLDLLLPLLDTPGVTFYCLQKGLTAREASTVDAMPQVVNVGGELLDFADTAALMRGLDLVISIDTAVVHLAGALGAPVWVLLPCRADWRWLLGRSDSPWYPTMRLFRQELEGEWEPVIAQVREALIKRILQGEADTP